MMYVDNVSTSDDSWPQFVKDFGQTIKHLTGLDLEARGSAEGHDAVLEDEIESLRAQVDELSKEVGSSVFSACISY